MNPAEVVLSGSMLLALPIALLAGALTFVSPCVLPLVPGYFGFLAGSATGRSRLVISTVLFVLGFTVVFVTLGVLAGSTALLVAANSFWVQFVLGLIVVVLGLAMLGNIGFLQRTIKIDYRPRVGLLGAPLLGLIFAVGWTPCIGPTLSAVLVLASDSGDPVRGGILATVYSLGIGIPFLLLAAGFGWATKSMAFFKRHIRTLNIIGSAMLIVIGLLLMTGLWNRFNIWLQEVTGGFQLLL